MCYVLPSYITSLQKDLNLPPPPTNTYKGFRMTMRIMLYSILWKVQVVQKGRFLRENPGSWEPEIYAKNPSTTSWGLLKTRVVLPERGSIPGKRPDLCIYHIIISTASSVHPIFIWVWNPHEFMFLLFSGWCRSFPHAWAGISGLAERDDSNHVRLTNV